MDLNSNMFKWLPITLILLFFYLFYFISSGGINTSNDGGHFALALSMYEDQSLEVGRFKDSFIRKPDYAVKDSTIYSDRLPGTAFLSLPFIAYADALSSSGFISPVKKGPGIPSDELTNYVLLLGAGLMIHLSGVIGLLMLYLICNEIFGFSRIISLVTTLICGLATLIHHESTHLFSHVPSMMLVTSAVYVALKKDMSIDRRLLLVSILIGVSSVVELQNIVFALPLFIYVLFSHVEGPMRLDRIPVKDMLASCVILAAFLGVLFSYNHAAFGEWILKSNAFNPFFPEERHFLSALSGDPIDGFDKLFTSFSNIEGWLNWDKAVKNSTPGIFVANPVFLVSLLGFVPFVNKFKKESMLFFSLILISVLIAAFHVTTLTRHIFTVHVLMFIPFAFVLDRVLRLNRILRSIALLVILLISVISIKRELFINVNYWGRDGLGQFPYAEFLKEFVLLNLPLLFLGIIFMMIYRPFRPQYR